jgi:hypothetical protein
MPLPDPDGEPPPGVGHVEPDDEPNADDTSQGCTSRQVPLAATCECYIHHDLHLIGTESCMCLACGSNLA